MAICMIFFHAFLSSITYATSATSSNALSPRDVYLVDCGATTSTTVVGSRIFKSDQFADADSLLSSREDIKVSIPRADVPLPIYLSARVFFREATYSFPISSTGWHFIRLHFYPFTTIKFDLQYAQFTVTADKWVLLQSLKFNNNSRWIVKEFLVNVTTTKGFSLKISPKGKSFGFVNGIEIVPTPNSLLTDVGSALHPVGNFSGLSTFSYETLHRVNIAGPLITSEEDALGRTWLPDAGYINSRFLAKSVSVSPSVISYSKQESKSIAPRLVYASAAQMADARITNPKFNITWSFEVDDEFVFLIRLHFCDIVSTSLNELYFHVYINGLKAISPLDLSSLTGGLAVPYFKDIVVDAALVTGELTVQIGPVDGYPGNRSVNAILNGLEIFKLSNVRGSLDGEFGVNGTKSTVNSTSNIKATMRFTMMFGAFIFLAAILVKWRRCLFLIRGVESSLTINKNSPGSPKKCLHSASTGPARRFAYTELLRATENFDSSKILGSGGFGNVYLGETDDGIKIAVKRADQNSEQGIDEFRTEIQLLSTLTHKNLVTLIGFCEENGELILVYDYQSLGTLREHLYGKKLPPLPWKRRLQICIGAAEGLCYLHKGAADGVIHRDIKSTNILLGDDFVPKVSDFGLSKRAPTMDKTHISTMVKGSCGYLDPEYYKSRQLTLKSDIYSFGVVLLELLCGRPAVNPALQKEEVLLAEWALKYKRMGLLYNIIDPALTGVNDPESVIMFADAAEKCLAEHGEDRPSMNEVLRSLESVLNLEVAALQGKTQPQDENATSVYITATIFPVVAVPTASTSAEQPFCVVERSGAVDV